MADTTIIKQIAKAIGIGFASGIGIVLVITMFTLPVSYIMNSYIYHNWVIRVSMGIYIGFLSALAFPIVIGLRLTGIWKKVTYFGLFPVIDSGEGIVEDSSWIAPLFSVIQWFMQPFSWSFDKAGYVAAVEQGMGLLSLGDKGAIDDKLYEDARTLATVVDTQKWTTLMAELKTRVPSSF
jgi:hypothetical protein